MKNKILYPALIFLMFLVPFNVYAEDTADISTSDTKPLSPMSYDDIDSFSLHISAFAGTFAYHHEINNAKDDEYKRLNQNLKGYDFFDIYSLLKIRLGTKTVSLVPTFNIAKSYFPLFSRSNTNREFMDNSKLWEGNIGLNLNFRVDETTIQKLTYRQYLSLFINANGIWLTENELMINFDLMLKYSLGPFNYIALGYRHLPTKEDYLYENKKHYMHVKFNFLVYNFNKNAQTFLFLGTYFPLKGAEDIYTFYTGFGVKTDLRSIKNQE